MYGSSFRHGTMTETVGMLCAFVDGAAGSPLPTCIGRGAVEKNVEPVGDGMLLSEGTDHFGRSKSARGN
jgi:hypothetical protein